ncbi:MAG TPA: cation:dicarboxylase symporter family transporter, partial [Atopostipes sp.]|nr:cation:dicarboxylase symporter family transporter [Atopostipes sp.]
TVMKIAPLGIFALLADVAGTIGLRVIAPMIQYLGILLVGVLLFMTFMVFVTSAIVRVNPALMPKNLLIYR